MITGTQFIYDGISSDEYELMICAIDTDGDETADMGLDVDIIYDDSNTPYIFDYGIRYSNRLNFEMSLVHRDGKAFTKTKTRQITKWLTGKKKPAWLQIYNGQYEDIQFLCRVTEIRKRKTGGNVIGFELVWTCNAPWGFSEEVIEKIKVTSADFPCELYNASDDDTPVYPQMEITVGNTDTLTIINTSEQNRLFSLTGLKKGDRVTIDNQNQLIYINGEFKYLGDDFNLHWFRMISGVNNLKINGESEITFCYRYPIKAGDI